jgi:DNA-binding MarR family transcriptional regulator
VHGRITAEIERELADAGLPPLTWYDVLWPLHRAPGRRLRVGALAAEVTISRTGLTRLVDRLEDAGLLRRVPAPEDGRGSYVVITPAGSRMLRKMWPVYERVLDEHFAARLRNPKSLTRALEPLSARNTQPT